MKIPVVETSEKVNRCTKFSIKPSGLQATLRSSWYHLPTTRPSCAVPTRNIWVGHSPPMFPAVLKESIASV